MGVFEHAAYAHGTRAIAHAVAQAFAMTSIGSRETGEAIYDTGQSDNMSFISTGGSAARQLREGKTLPGLATLPSHGRVRDWVYGANAPRMIA